MTEVTHKPRVTQADRSRAKFLHIQLNENMPQKWLRDLSEGRCDGDRIVTTLARHREASQAELLEALEDAARNFDLMAASLKDEGLFASARHPEKWATAARAAIAKAKGAA